MNYNENKKISTDRFEVIVLEKGIVENYIKPGIILEPEDMIELRNTNFKLIGNVPYVLLVTSGEMASISKEARELSASKEFIQNSLAKAIVVKSVGDKIISNFYLKINKPYLQTRIFSDRQDALKWLRTMLK